MVGKTFWLGVGMSRAWTTGTTEGSLIIDIVDAKTGKLVWQRYRKLESEM